MSRRAQVHTSLLGLVVVVFAAVPFVWPRYWFTASAAAQAPAIPTDFKATLIRAGLGADALCAAGVSSGSVSSALSAVAAAINVNPTLISSTDASYASARRDVDRLKALIESGRGSQEDVSAYQTASASLTTATAARQAALDAIFTAGTANLSAGQRAALTQIRANHAYELPLEFLAVERTQTEWVDVRDALANERISAKLGDEPDAGNQASLATWRANATVSSAKTSLDTNLPGVTSAWNSAAAQ